MRKHVLYALVMFGCAWLVYLDEVRPRLFPWAGDLSTNGREQITLLQADAVALVVCAVLVFTPVVVHWHSTRTTRIPHRGCGHYPYDWSQEG